MKLIIAINLTSLVLIKGLFATVLSDNMPRRQSFSKRKPVLLEKVVNVNGYNVKEYEAEGTKQNHLQKRGGNNENERNNVGKKKTAYEEVKFTATKTLATPNLPLPPKHSEAAIYDFFENRENTNLLFSSDAVIEEIKNPSKELIDFFRHRSFSCQREAGLEPEPISDEEGDVTYRIVKLVNAPMEFIGVKLNSIAIVGIQLLRGADRKSGEVTMNSKRRQFLGYPELQFTLLDAIYEASGPRPLVWLFYKIIGQQTNVKDLIQDSEKNNDYIIRTEESLRSHRLQTTGFTRVWAEPVHIAETKMIRFVNKAKLEGRIRIPSLLLAVLPTTLEKLEKQGSKTVNNEIEKDIGPGMQRYQNAYIEWLSKNLQAAV